MPSYDDRFLFASEIFVVGIKAIQVVSTLDTLLSLILELILNAALAKIAIL